MRRERVAVRRQGQLEAMRTKQQTSRVGALERHEPFPMRKEMQLHRSNFHERQRERAWSQSIVFLPPPVAARERFLVKERMATDYMEGVQQVQDLP